MLAASTDPDSTRFTRRDAGRLLAASVLLVAAMSIVLGLDFLPAQDQLEHGQAGTGERPAPRAGEYTSEVLTERASRGGAGRRRAPVRLHDRARRIGRRPAGPRARAPGRPDRCRVRGRRRARGPRDAPRGRPARARSAPTIARRSWRWTPERWAAVRAESARVLDTVERSELRDTEVASIRDGIEMRFAGRPQRGGDVARRRADPAAGRAQLVVLRGAHRPGAEPGRRGGAGRGQGVGAGRDHRPQRRPRGRGRPRGDRLLPAQHGRPRRRAAARVRGALGARHRPAPHLDLAVPAASSGTATTCCCCSAWCC